MKRSVALLVSGIACLVVFSQTAAAVEVSGSALGTNYDVVVLTPGHSRTIYYDLSDTIFSNGSAFQATAILTVGAGTLLVGIGNSSPIGTGSEIVYGTTGFVGATPVLQYSYSSSPVDISVPVGDVSIGVLFTSVVLSVGDPDFPVTMSMVFSLN